MNENEYVDINAHDNYPDSDQKIEIPTMKVIPLKKICMTIGEIPTSYLETMTYYEMLVWFIEYLKNNIIPTVNNNAEAIQEVQTVVLALQNYINDYKDSIDQDVEELEEYMNNYFENLDVQDEINNKLDEMLEDGVLEQIIEQFIQSTALWTFDTVNDMKEATNLINGSYAQTLGYYSINDGGGSLYKITNEENSNVYQEELESGLYATLINSENNVKCYGATGDGETDDTTSFYKAFEYSNKIFIPDGSYLIDYANMNLANKNITGIEDKTIIIQKNSNVPFGLVGENTVIKNIIFRSLNNVSDETNNYINESVLYFGHNGTSFVIFKNHDLENLKFYGNEYSIPLLFNMNDGGCVGGTIRNIWIYTCNNGIMFNFYEKISHNNWINGQTFNKIWIERPYNYGLYWTGTVNNQNNNSYANEFNDISVELFVNNSTGLHVGGHMGTLNRITVYNDINGSSNKGYSLEFEKTDDIAPRDITTITNSHFEGLIKNEYNKLSYKIFNCTYNIYNYFGETNPLRIEDFSKPIQLVPYDIMDLSTYTNNTANNIEINNVTIEKKLDSHGWYLSIKKVDYSVGGNIRFKLSSTLPDDINYHDYFTLACECTSGYTNVLPQFYSQGTFSQQRKLAAESSTMYYMTQWLDLSVYEDWNDFQFYMNFPASLPSGYEFKIYNMAVYIGRGGTWIFDK